MLTLLYGVDIPVLLCRVGNDVFKKAFHSMVGTSIRVVHGGDLVPALPPAFT